MIRFKADGSESIRKRPRRGLGHAQIILVAQDHPDVINAAPVAVAIIGVLNALGVYQGALYAGVGAGCKMPRRRKPTHLRRQRLCSYPSDRLACAFRKTDAR